MKLLSIFSPCFKKDSAIIEKIKKKQKFVMDKIFSKHAEKRDSLLYS
jgi:hypothetical protein